MSLKVVHLYTIYWFGCLVFSKKKKKNHVFVGILFTFFSSCVFPRVSIFNAIALRIKRRRSKIIFECYAVRSQIQYIEQHWAWAYTMLVSGFHWITSPWTEYFAAKLYANAMHDASAMHNVHSVHSKRELSIHGSWLKCIYIALYWIYVQTTPWLRNHIHCIGRAKQSQVFFFYLIYYYFGIPY